MTGVCRCKAGGAAFKCHSKVYPLAGFTIKVTLGESAERSHGQASLVCLSALEAVVGTLGMVVEQRLREKLAGALAPVHLEVVNESGQHNVPAGSETHFKVVVVSDAFAGKPRVAQHRMVFRAVDDEMRGGVHALAVHTYTQDAWARTGAAAPESPKCLGGKAREST